MSSKVTGDDFDWFGMAYENLLEVGYCITLVSSITPSETITALSAEPAGEALGFDELSEPTSAAIEQSSGHNLLVGLTAVDDSWTLMVEENGSVGINNALMMPLSAGRQIVANYQGANASSQFIWWSDGITKLSFEPLFATRRSGSDPDGLVADMQAVEFNMDDEPDIDLDFRPWASAFALAERITGVTIDADVLGGATYQLARVPLPPLHP